MVKTERKLLTNVTMIWFGAAVSVAEILTGTLFAPLGFWEALAAIVLGHAIGCVFLYFAGLAGAIHGKSAMETAKITYGDKGAKFFAGLNILQLIGWTAVMISAGAVSAQTVFPLGNWCWAIVIGGLIVLWILVDVGCLNKMNVITVCLLFLLSLLMSKAVFHQSATIVDGSSLRFGDALELSIAMPVSWLPLIADYTSGSKWPNGVSLVCTGVYFIVSCWMYLIGYGAAAYAGESDIAAIMLKSGFGVSAILIVVLSTVTTTYLDVYSAGVSMQSICKCLPVKLTGVVVCIGGTLLAIFCNTSAFENFLYWIGSVFVPMISVQIVDVFLFRHNETAENRTFSVSNIVLWGVGFIIYRIFLRCALPCGSTIPAAILTMLVTVLIKGITIQKEKIKR